MKLSLILNVIDPKIGGVMIMGDRGTGKSTIVRALVDLLPEINVIANDPFNSDPNDPELMIEEIREKLQNKEKQKKNSFSTHSEQNKIDKQNYILESEINLSKPIAIKSILNPNNNKNNNIQNNERSDKSSTISNSKNEKIS